MEITNLTIKPDRKLLDAKFEGYKLSLDKLPLLRKSIKGIQNAECNPDSYCYQQVQMVCFLNQLFQDPWDLHSLFFVSAENVVTWIALKPDEQLSEEQEVWRIPAPCKTATMGFPSKSFSLVCDGINKVFILHCNSRAAGMSWTLVHTFILDDNCQPPLHLLHSTSRNTPSGPLVEFLIARVASPRQFSDFPKDSSENFICILDWVVLTSDTQFTNWSVKRHRTLTGGSFPKYAAIEPTGEALYLVSEKTFTFLHDSEVPDEEMKETQEQPEEEKPLYTYLQTPDDITLVFIVPEDFQKEAISVTFGLKHLKVELFNSVVMDCTLWKEIEKDACTWTREGNRLEIVLTKYHEGVMWPMVVLGGDKRGKEISDPALAAEFHSMLAHLTTASPDDESRKPMINSQQLEECDFTGEVLKLVRLDGESRRITHMANMDCHQWLFTFPTSRRDTLPAFCLRHDVDGLVWEFDIYAGEKLKDYVQLSHVATFSALGYVQASKRERKYTVAAPNFSFVVISDTTRHLFVYDQPSPVSSLRNRKAGTEVQHVAKQHVVYLEDCTSILGLQASEHYIFALSPDAFYAIKVLL